MNRHPVLASFERLRAAANNVDDLLRDARICGTHGDTAHDLKAAVAAHGHVLYQYHVTIRTQEHVEAFQAPAESSYEAYRAAAATQGDKPCGITVTAVSHDALTDAHRILMISGSVDHALKVPALAVAIKTFARGKPRKKRTTIPATDYKRQAANDFD